MSRPRGAVQRSAVEAVRAGARTSPEIAERLQGDPDLAGITSSSVCHALQTAVQAGALARSGRRGGGDREGFRYYVVPRE